MVARGFPFVADGIGEFVEVVLRFAGHDGEGGGGEAGADGIARRRGFTGRGARSGGVLGCAGINRHEVGNERVLQERR